MAFSFYLLSGNNVVQIMQTIFKIYNLTYLLYQIIKNCILHFIIDIILLKRYVEFLQYILADRNNLKKYLFFGFKHVGFRFIDKCLK